MENWIYQANRTNCMTINLWHLHRKIGLGVIKEYISAFLLCSHSRQTYRALTKPIRSFQSWRGVGLALLICGFSTGCITDTTVNLTKAPFDASTELTDGTSQATTDLTEPTREFLSSTTPGAWFHADGTLNPDHKKIAFIVLNFDNLQEDIAHGSGEYLISLSTLVGVPTDSRERFMKSAQNQYAYIFEEQQSRSESLKRLLRTLPIMQLPS